MTKATRKAIADRILAAKLQCEKALGSYRPYQPALDHEDAVKQLEEAQIWIDSAKEIILKHTTKQG